MPILLFQIVTLLADILIFIFVIFYIIRIRSEEKILKEKETKTDTSYHQVVDDALAHERKILDDAATEASQIITGAQYLSDTTKNTINQTLQAVVVDIQKQAVDTAGTFMGSYQESLKQIVTTSLSEFQKITQTLESDLQNQIKDFHNSVLPGLQKELEEYKKSRMQDTEKMIIQIVQKVSQDVLNKSLSLSDHETLLVDSLEKAKKEGIFD